MGTLLPVNLKLPRNWLAFFWGGGALVGFIVGLLGYGVLFIF